MTYSELSMPEACTLHYVAVGIVVLAFVPRKTMSCQAAMSELPCCPFAAHAKQVSRRDAEVFMQSMFMVMLTATAA